MNLPKLVATLTAGELGLVRDRMPSDRVYFLGHATIQEIADAWGEIALRGFDGFDPVANVRDGQDVDPFVFWGWLMASKCASVAGPPLYVTPSAENAFEPRMHPVAPFGLVLNPGTESLRLHHQTADGRVETWVRIAPGEILYLTRLEEWTHPEGTLCIRYPDLSAPNTPAFALPQKDFPVSRVIPPLRPPASVPDDALVWAFQFAPEVKSTAKKKPAAAANTATARSSFGDDSKSPEAEAFRAFVAAHTTEPGQLVSDAEFADFDVFHIINPGVVPLVLLAVPHEDRSWIYAVSTKHKTDKELAAYVVKDVLQDKARIVTSHVARTEKQQAEPGEWDSLFD
jgi:hypothetical protein